jgi:hypothetical protein
MLDLKGIDYELATVLPGTQRIHLRLVGFRGGTVPALKLDRRRILRWGLVRDLALRRWRAEQSAMPVPAAAARASGPVAW